jgi:hypothetical protein
VLAPGCAHDEGNDGYTTANVQVIEPQAALSNRLPWLMPG